MQYLCKAGQQVRAKAQDSAPDKDRMPLLGAPSLADKQARALQMQQDDCQQNQDNSLCCVYYISRAWEEVTTEPVQHSKNRLLISVIKRKSV